MKSVLALTPATHAPSLRVRRVMVRPEQPPGRGFTLIELLVVIAIIAILASLLLPTLAKSKTQAQGIQCMNNTHELTVAWIMYVDDSAGKLPINVPFSPPGVTVWVDGWLTQNPNDPDNTNILYLQNSAPGPYAKSVSVWRCPADTSTALEFGRSYPRVRSVSMNGWLNNVLDPYPNSAGVRKAVKLSDIIDPPPANAFVLLDERQDSINDGYFAVDILDTGTSALIYDWPASYHNGAAGFSFADGHSEIHKWMDLRTVPPIGHQLTIEPSPNNPDLAWLQAHSATRVPTGGRPF